MHCLGPGGFYYVEYGFHFKITLVGWGWADAISLICLLHKHTMAVSVRINSDRLDAHFLAGLDDTACDLSAISNEDFVECFGLALG
jgi:hypothetical protein